VLSTDFETSNVDLVAKLFEVEAKGDLDVHPDLLVDQELASVAVPVNGPLPLMRRRRYLTVD